MTPLTNYRGVNMEGLFAIQQSDTINVAVLLPGAMQMFTIPIGAKYILLNSIGDFWFKVDEHAVIPLTSITDGTGSEFKPMLRVLENNHTFSLISAAGATVVLSFYK